MKLSIRYMLLFSATVIAGVYLHEIGHAVAGWLNGVAIVPTPAKEYILQLELDWSKEIWIALGGVIGTTVAALAVALCFDICWWEEGTTLRSGRLHKLLSVCRLLATR